MRKTHSSIWSVFVNCVVLAVNPVSAADAPAFTTIASLARTKDNVEFIIGPVYANALEQSVS